MQFDSWSAFFAMGGHGFYVWLAYGATLLVLLISYLSVRSSRKRLHEAFKWEQGGAPGGGHKQGPANSEEEDIKL